MRKSRVEKFKMTNIPFEPVLLDLRRWSDEIRCWSDFTKYYLVKSDQRLRYLHILSTFYFSSDTLRQVSFNKIGVREQKSRISHLYSRSHYILCTELYPCSLFCFFLFAAVGNEEGTKILFYDRSRCSSTFELNL